MISRIESHWRLVVVMGVIVISCAVLFNTIFSYATPEGTSTIYTRDELSELLKMQDEEIESSLDIINSSKSDLTLYINGQKKSGINPNYKYILTSYNCKNGQTITWNSENTTMSISGFQNALECSIHLGILSNYIFNSSELFYTFRVPDDGVYKIELWGASGGDISGTGYDNNDVARGLLQYNGGNGAYTSGNIYLNGNTELYIYVGGHGEDNADGISRNYTGGYNGGGTLDYEISSVYASPGGGATDIRTVSGLWNNFSSLKSRIMVAAGGGGANFRNFGYGEGNGGSGGTLNGLPGEEALVPGSYFRSDYSPGYTIGNGGTQTEGGCRIHYNLNGTVIPSCATGKGLFGQNNGCDQTGGGAGYYNGACSFHGGAGGGSSFVSGCTGCNAITEESIESAIVHTNQPVHYSGLSFTNISMIPGNAVMPNPNGGTMIGNDGNGYARITFVE